MNTQRLLKDCEKLRHDSRLLRDLANALQSRSCELGREQDDLVLQIRKAGREAEENLPVRDWQFHLFTLKPQEQTEAEQIWCDLRDGVVGAQKRLLRLPDPTRLLILEALRASMMSGKTGNTLFAALASK